MDLTSGIHGCRRCLPRATLRYVSLLTWACSSHRSVVRIRAVVTAWPGCRRTELSSSEHHLSKTSLYTLIQRFTFNACISICVLPTLWCKYNLLWKCASTTSKSTPRGGETPPIRPPFLTHFWQAQNWLHTRASCLLCNLGESSNLLHHPYAIVL